MATKVGRLPHAELFGVGVACSQRSIQRGAKAPTGQVVAGVGADEKVAGRGLTVRFKLLRLLRCENVRCENEGANQFGETFCGRVVMLLYVGSGSSGGLLIEKEMAIALSRVGFIGGDRQNPQISPQSGPALNLFKQGQ